MYTFRLFGAGQGSRELQEDRDKTKQFIDEPELSMKIPDKLKQERTKDFPPTGKDFGDGSNNPVDFGKGGFSQPSPACVCEGDMNGPVGTIKYDNG